MTSTEKTPEPTSLEALQNRKFEMMTKAPLAPLLLKLALPAMISMLITSFYNLGDTYFISHIKTRYSESVAAVGILFTYQALIQATGFFFGHGSGNFISRALGAKKRQDAAKMAATGVVSAFIAGSLIGLIALVIPETLLGFLGCREEILPEALAYLRPIACATPLMTSTLVLNNQLRLQGNAHRGMIGMTSGAIFNLLLDPLLIFELDLGIAGAAYATAISQALAFGILLLMTRRGDSIAPRLKNFSPTLQNYKEILAGGLPSLARQALTALAGLVLNHCAGAYGPDALAGLTIVTRILFLVVCIDIGLGQGFQPICGFNYGAENYDRVRRAYWFVVKLGCLIFCVVMISLFCFDKTVIDLFHTTGQSYDVALRALHRQSLTLPFRSFMMMTGMYLQNTRQPIRASIQSSMPNGISFVPSLLLLNGLFGLDGLLWAQPLADLLGFFVAVPFAIAALRDLTRRENALLAQSQQQQKDL